MTATYVFIANAVYYYGPTHCVGAVITTCALDAVVIYYWFCCYGNDSPSLFCCYPLVHTSFNGKRDLLGGGACHLKFTDIRISDFIYDACGLSDLSKAKIRVEFQCDTEAVPAALAKKTSFIAADIPLNILVPCLTKTELISVAAQHSVHLPRQFKL